MHENLSNLFGLSYVFAICLFDHKVLFNIDHDLKKLKINMWWQISWSGEEIMWRTSLCHQESCFTDCLQVCWVLHFLARYNPTYVTEKSLTDAKSIAQIRFATNLVLLRNMWNLWNCGHLHQEMLSHLFFLTTWMKPTVLKMAWYKAISTDVWD